MSDDSWLPPDPRSFEVPAPAPGAGPIPAPAPTPDVGPPPPDADVPELDDELAPDAPTARPRRRWKRWLLAAAVLVLMAVVAESAYLWSVWGRVDRVDLEQSLTPADGAARNYLIVGSDSREGVSPDDPNAAVILGEGLGDSERTDTMLVLRTHPDGNTMMAVPRDLWVTVAETGDEGRINAAIQGGPARLVDTVEQNLGIPINHYVAVDFVGFGDLVDALGGITIDFPHPAYDRNSGLDVPDAGPNRLDGTDSLAYVRSRYYTELIDGQPVADPRSDLGRIERQQLFFRTVVDDIQGTRNPFVLNRLAAGMADSLTVDDEFGAGDVFDLTRRMRSSDPESVVLPVYPFRTDGGAAVLGLADGAEAALDRFR